MPHKPCDLGCAMLAFLSDGLTACVVSLQVCYDAVRDFAHPAVLVSAGWGICLVMV
jgi:hypothetical protein